MGNLEHALSAYENALRHNPRSLPGLTQVAGIARIKENYPKVRNVPTRLQSRFLFFFSLSRFAGVKHWLTSADRYSIYGISHLSRFFTCQFDLRSDTFLFRQSIIFNVS